MNMSDRYWILPIALIVALLVFIGQKQMKYNAVVKDVNHLQSKVVGKSPKGWHRDDMEDWCFEAVVLNPGFICPEITYEGE